MITKTLTAFIALTLTTAALAQVPGQPQMPFNTLPTPAASSPAVIPPAPAPQVPPITQTQNPVPAGKPPTAITPGAAGQPATPGRTVQPPNGVNAQGVNLPSGAQINQQGQLVNQQGQPIAAKTENRVAKPSNSLAAETERQINDQLNGDFGEMSRDALPLGQIQRAWDAPAAAPGQQAPGFVNYNYDARVTMPVATRTMMQTTIQIPADDVINDIVNGDDVFFEVRKTGQRTLAVKALRAGADTSIHVIGTTGRIYLFYVRSHNWNTRQITDQLVTVSFDGPQSIPQTSGLPETRTPTSNVFNPTDGRVVAPINTPNTPDIRRLPRPGQSSDASNDTGVQYASANGTTVAGATTSRAVSSNMMTASPNQPTQAMAPGTTNVPARLDYLRQVAYNPNDLKFSQHRIFAPTEFDLSLRPDRVYHDGVFTYIDYGPRGDAFARPVAFLLVGGVDTMINTSWIGEKQEILAVHAVGDISLRNGNQVICIRYTPPENDNVLIASPRVDPDAPKQRKDPPRKSTSTNAINPIGWFLNLF